MVAPPVSRLFGLELVMCVDAARVTELMLTLEGLAKPHAGCVERGAFRDVENPLRLLWVERWREEAELRAYLDSESFRALLGAAEFLAHVEDLRFTEESARVEPPLQRKENDR